MQVATDGSTANVLWVGAAEIASAIEQPALLRSADGGQTWESTFQWRNNLNVYTSWYGAGMDYDWSYAGAPSTISVALGQANSVSFTNLFGAWATADGGKTWRSLLSAQSAQNLPGVTGRPNAFHASTINNTTSWHLNWLSSNTIFVGSNDITAFRSTDAGKTWQFPKYNGARLNATYKTAYDAKTRILYAAMSNSHDLYYGTNMSDGNVDGRGGAIFYSTDRGLNWSPFRIFEQTASNGQKYSDPVLSVELDPTSFDRMYALVGSRTNGGVYRTNNLSARAAATWTKLPNPPRTEGHPWDMRVLRDGSLVVSYAGRLTSSGMTESSGIFYSANGGQTWEDRTAAASLSRMHLLTQDIVIDPRDASQNTWYACVDFSWYLPDAWPDPPVGLFRTTDRGRTWKRIFSETRVGARSVAINPATHQMYVGTNNGLYYSNNSQLDQPTFTRVPAVKFPLVNRVFLNPYKLSEVWLVTFGGGVLVGDATTP